MRTVHKFPLPRGLTMGDAVEIEMPHGKSIVHFAVHEGVPTIWAMVDTAQPLTPCTFRIFGTGQELPFHGAVHVGTMFFPPFVWHVYEVTYA